jgi:hypothetical protein
MLSREHVAPEGLMGKWELIAASCSTHRKLTSYFEMKALEGPLQPARLHFKMYGSRWKKRYRHNHPGGDPDNPVIEERFLLRDGSIEKVEIPVSRHPYVLHMPAYRRWPEILSGGDRWAVGRIPSHKYATDRGLDSDHRSDLLLAENPKRFVMLPRLDDENLMKMLAKTCYCMAIYLETEPFRPLILKYLTSRRGDNSWCRYFVGGPLPRPSLQMQGGRRHGIHVRYEIDKQNPKLKYVVGRIQLCISNFMPAYDIVLGTTL